jgi:hypothetical protein
MNDLQKKFAIVGLTAFIAWFLIGLDFSNGIYNISDFDEFLYDFITRFWYQTVFFITWLGSLIAFFIYKD